jgi:cytochrome c-type biogenesis protein
VFAVTITSLSLGSLGLAFVAGLISFISPCVLPLLPVYLSYIGGVDVDELKAERRRVLGVALFFVAGFTVVFVLLGFGAGGVGSLLVAYRHPLTIAAGVFIAGSGLVVADVLHLPEVILPLNPRGGGRAGAFVTGAAVAIAWTPCVGYVLGGILVLAGSGHSAWQGGVLLLVYSAGLGLPFVAAALAFDWVAARTAVIKRHYRAVQVTAGSLLVVFGVLLASGLLDRFTHMLPGVSPGGL